MTTAVKISASCSDLYEVVIVVSEGDEVVEEVVAQNAEVKEVYAYGDRVVTVRERLKEEVEHQE